MTFDNFKVAFPYYTIAMYQDWKIDRAIFTKKAEQFNYSITSNIAQEAIVLFEYQNERQYPPKCGNGKNHDLNIFITDMGTREREQDSMFKSLGYGYYKWKNGLKAGTEYYITFYDWSGARKQDLTVTLYTSNSRVKLKEAGWST